MGGDRLRSLPLLARIATVASPLLPPFRAGSGPVRRPGVAQATSLHRLLLPELRDADQDVDLSMPIQEDPLPATTTRELRGNKPMSREFHERWL